MGDVVAAMAATGPGPGIMRADGGLRY